MAHGDGLAVPEPDDVDVSGAGALSSRGERIARWPPRCPAGLPGTENVSDAKVDLRTVSVPFGGSTVEEFRTIAEQDRHATAYPLVHKGFDDYTMTALFHDPIESAEDGGNKAVGQTMERRLLRSSASIRKRFSV